MLRNGAKFLQRRLYSYVSTWTGFTIFLILCYFLVATIIESLSNSCSLRGLHSHCSLRHSDDNIAFKNLEGELSYQPFDVVYTWVNGSDPKWLAKKEKWSSPKSVKSEAGATSSNVTASPSNHTLEVSLALETNATVPLKSTTGETETEVEADDTMSSNRYRDSEELRFSLRSLVKNAPWIRHIYIVTDNQVPYWLNLESTRLTVVPHEDIFLNKSHLPVFSSPAIEANLHRIPGLSKKFIYFNDDVFLGARTLPEDFISMRGAQKLVMSWDVPKCAPGCSDTWIGDGFCDKACNVSACNFDFPDCVNGTNSNAHGTTSTRASSSLAMCNKGCPDNWLADKICDQRCKNAECGWDVGDCGLDLVALSYPGVAIDTSNARILSVSSSSYNAEYGPSIGAYGHYGDPSGYFHSNEELTLDQIRAEFESEISNNTLAGLDSSAVPAELTHATHGANETDASSTAPAVDINATAPADPSTYRGRHHRHGSNQQHMYPALTVEYGTPAVYFDLAHLGCLYSLNATCIPEQVTTADVVYERVEHDDEEGMVVHTTTLLTKHHVLVVLLYHGQDGVLPFVAASQDVKISVSATSALTSESTTATFSLRVTAQGSLTTVAHPLELVPQGMALMMNQSFAGACKDVKQTREEREKMSLSLEGLALVSHPYRVRKPDTVEEGVILSGAVSLQGTTDLAHTDCAQVALSYELTDVTGGNHGLVLPLCDAVLVFAPSESESGEFGPYNSSNARTVQAVLSAAALSSEAFAQYVASKDPPRSARFLPQPESVRVLLPVLDSSNTTAADNNATATDAILTAPAQQGVKSYFVHLRVPLPRTWAEMPHSRWFHVHAKFMHLPAQQAENNGIFGRWVDHSPEAVPGAAPLNCFTAAVKWGVDRPPVNVTDNIAIERAEAVPVTANNVTSSVSELLVAANETAEHLPAPPAPAVTNSLELGTTEFASADPHRRKLSAEHGLDASLLASLCNKISELASSVVAWLSPSDSSSSAPMRRRLEDTYGLSLVHVNRLYTKAFGTEGRKVPAHVPHMIDREYMDEMQERWPEQWNATSAHRFRSPTDMQYSFSYYYYLSNRIKVKPHDLAKHVSKVLDTDGDGLLNENEFRSLAAMVKGSSSPSPQFIEEMYECIANNSATFRRQHTEEVVHSTRRGKVSKSFHIQPHPTIAEALNCTDIIETGLQQKVNWANLYPSHTHESDKDLVAFEMIGDNYTISMGQLDSVRQRQSKFVCINDNMKNPSKELEQALRSFYLSFFPEPCVFELPPGQRNPTLYLDEYQQIMRQKGQLSRRVATAVLSFPTAVTRWVWRSLQTVLLPVARHAADLLSDEESAAATQANAELYVNGLRQDIARHPHYNSRAAAAEKEDAEWAAYMRNVLLFSVVGVVGFVILRQLSKANRAN